MAKLENAILAFNRGIVSPLALSRVDLQRLAWSCEEMLNWMPRAFGSMMIRPGLGYIGATRNNQASRSIAFVRSSSEKHMLEFTNLRMRVWTSDALVTRPAVTAAVANGDFNTNLTSWTDADEAGATSAWVTGGYMGLTGDGTNFAIRRQQVAVNEQGTEHALKIVVERGPVILKVGSTSGTDNYIEETTLGTGEHSLAFTPSTANFWIQFQQNLQRQVLVTSCNIEAAGVMSLATPWLESMLQTIRGSVDSQSVDVMFLSHQDRTTVRVERRGATSWSLVRYEPLDGPFENENTGAITIDPSAQSGNITLTASQPLFRDEHAPDNSSIGALFKLTSDGQRVTTDADAEGEWTDAIRVTGVDSARAFTVKITGTWVATITLQRSIESASGAWENVTTYTSNTTVSFDDGLDNLVAWYRLGIDTGDYTSGTATLLLRYPLGSIVGIARVTGVTSSTVVDAEVISTLGDISAHQFWNEGSWSRYRGWPSACALYESRLVLAGLDKFWASLIDAFDSFDESFEGDGGTISRSIGAGPMQNIGWLASLERLIAGADLNEITIRSNSFDEPLTPTNTNIKRSSRQGTHDVQAEGLDDQVVFAQRGGTRLIELEFQPDSMKYQANDLCQLAPEICQPSIRRIGVQRQPDVRIHCVLSDGTVAVLVYDKTEKVACWLKVDTDGDVEDVCILPGGTGEGEDRVYYTVNRTINGSTVRYIEKWALESECVGGSLNKQADSFVTFSQASSTTVSGLSHLVGESVVVWQNGTCPEDADGDPKTYTVSGAGTITLDTAATAGVVGLPYDVEWESAKLGKSINALKTVTSIGLVLANAHPKAIKYGPSLTESEMSHMPLVEDGAEINEDTIYSTYDEPPFEFDGDWDADSRVCLRGYVPRPATICAATINGTVNA